MKQSLLAFLLLGALSAQAQVQFGEIISAGTGCTAQDPLPHVEIENGKGVLSISSLNVVANSQTTSLISREACNLRLQVAVEKGHQLGIRISDVRGTLIQDKGVQTTVAATAGLVTRQQEQSLTAKYTAKARGRIKIANKAEEDSFSWTGCSGEQTMLALSVNASVIRPKTTAKVNATVKTVNFEVAVRACE